MRRRIQRTRNKPSIPRSLEPVYIWNPPVENGEYVTLSSVSTLHRWYKVDPATGGDYVGGILHRSNYEALADELEEHHPPDQDPPVWGRFTGGHGTYGIVVDWPNLDQEIKDLLDRLDSHPVVDEEAYSDLMIEAEEEVWGTWAGPEFIRKLEEILDLEELDDEIDVRELWHEAMEDANVYWEDTDEGITIDVDRVAEAAAAILSAPAPKPQWQKALQTIQAHRRAIGQAPLDPAAAGWTEKDIVEEAARIRELNPYGPCRRCLVRHGRAANAGQLRRRLLR